MKSLLSNGSLPTILFGFLFPSLLQLGRASLRDAWGNSALDQSCDTNPNLINSDPSSVFCPHRYKTKVYILQYIETLVNPCGTLHLGLSFPITTTRGLYCSGSLFCSPHCLCHAWMPDYCEFPFTEVADGLCCVLTTPCLAQNTPAPTAQPSPCTSPGSPVTLRQKTFDWKRVSRCVRGCMHVHVPVCVLLINTY